MRAAVCKRVALTEDGVVSPVIAWTVTVFAGRTKSGKARVAPVVEEIAREELPGRTGGGRTTPSARVRASCEGGPGEPREAVALVGGGADAVGGGPCAQRGSLQPGHGVLPVRLMWANCGASAVISGDKQKIHIHRPCHRNGRQYQPYERWRRLAKGFRPERTHARSTDGDKGHIGRPRRRLPATSR